MKRAILIFTVLALCLVSVAQEKIVDKTQIREDLQQLLTDLKKRYVYLKNKNVDITCVQQHYEDKIENLQTKEDVVLFFEYILDEFYDNHLILNINTKSSFRLWAAIYAIMQQGKPVISNIWHTQIEAPVPDVIGAEILKVNGVNIEEAINLFPTRCADKTSVAVREWIINKLLAGRYNEPRVLQLKLADGKIVEFDPDKVKLKRHQYLLTTKRSGDIGIITVNNSLGDNNLIAEFDKAIDSLMDTKGLVLDLRNTVDGGNSYVARGLMSRFINKTLPYQKHWTMEQYGSNPPVERSWIEYVSPRLTQYKKAVVVLVGRWTGSMGEGLAIGFEGIGRGKIVGTEMERLAGEMDAFDFKHSKFSYRISTAKLFHINGTPREKYIPPYYVRQTTTMRDETLLKGIAILNERN